MVKLNLRELIQELQKARRLIPKETEKIVLKSKDLKKEKVNEFKRAERPDGSDIGEYRNAMYRAFKRRLNPLNRGKVDLILTGSFTKKLFLEKKGKNKFRFKSSDEKAPMLFKKYGTDLRGLNQITTDEVQAEKLSIELIKRLKQKTKLK